MGGVGEGGAGRGCQKPLSAGSTLGSMWPSPGRETSASQPPCLHRLPALASPLSHPELPLPVPLPLPLWQLFGHSPRPPGRDGTEEGGCISPQPASEQPQASGLSLQLPLTWVARHPPVHRDALMGTTVLDTPSTVNAALSGESLTSQKQPTHPWSPGSTGPALPGPGPQSTWPKNGHMMNKFQAGTTPQPTATLANDKNPNPRSTFPTECPPGPAAWWVVSRKPRDKLFG